MRQSEAPKFSSLCTDILPSKSFCAATLSSNGAAFLTVSGAKKNAGKSNNKGRSGAGKKNGAKKEPLSGQGTIGEFVQRREFKAGVIFVCGLVLLIVAIFAGQDGTLWNKIHNFYFAVFGISGLYIPAAVLFLGVVNVLNRNKPVYLIKLLEVFLLFVGVCGLIHINGVAAQSDKGFGENLRVVYEGIMHYGRSPFGSGGVIGALFGGGLYQLGKSQVLANIICVLFILAVMMLVSLCGMLPTAALAEGAPDPAASPQEAAPLQDHLVSTKHTAVINGTELAYTAEAGTVVLTTGGETCEIFYTAYTLDGVEDRTERPITFAFNGGPGVCSMYLHVGCLGPRCIELDENGYAVRMPTRIIDNNNSLLDITDLVFIDAVGTGYSRAAGSSEIDAFIGYENDNRTIGDFIRQYVSRNDRWESEKYLIGESYGTVRAVGVCEYLADAYGMYLNGLALISSANDYLMKRIIKTGCYLEGSIL